MNISPVGKNSEFLATAIKRPPGVKFVIEQLGEEMTAKIFDFFQHQHVKMLDPSTLQNPDRFFGAGNVCTALDPAIVRFSSLSCCEHPKLQTDRPPANMEEQIIAEFRDALKLWIKENPPPDASSSPAP